MGATIKLTQGKVAIVDDGDFEWLSQWKWQYHSRGYAHRNAGNGKWVLMHRLIMGEPTGKDIDHIDGDKLNNSRSNLRACTRSQNLCNQRISSKNTSGFRGVSKFRATKWQVYINVKGRRYHIGHFVSKKAAALAYNEAALKLHGKYARLNNV